MRVRNRSPIIKALKNLAYYIYSKERVNVVFAIEGILIGNMGACAFGSLYV